MKATSDPVTVAAVSVLFIGGAASPSLFKQDPRYFYKGTGTKHSRFLYAISRTLICKGDNQRWQPNYSSATSPLAAFLVYTSRRETVTAPD